MIKKQPSYKDEIRSVGDRLIPKHATTEVLEELGTTLNFIEIWLKVSEENYEVICGMYNKATKYTFKQIPTTMTKSLSPKQKSRKLMTEIGGGWYMKTIAKGLPPPRRPKPSKKSQYKEDETKKLYEANKWWNDRRFQLH